MDFAMTDNGGSIDLVCKMVVFDHTHESHLMMTLYDGKLFHYDGLLEEGHETFTLFGACMVQQYPFTKVVALPTTKVLGHPKPSWDSLFRVVDLCSGFGGLAQGAIAAGFEIAVAIDQNQRILDLYGKISSAPRIHADFGQKDTLCEIWRLSKGARVLTSGFSCQPFSQLGDRRSHQDDRASCLPKTLAAAYYLQSKVLILECVSPAAQDSFVKEELQHFMSCTGFTCAQIDLKLDAVWPCRRQRAWWLLVAPELGPIDMHPWSVLTDISQVQQVLPSIQLWPLEDEYELALDQEELAAFGVDTEEHGKNMLNAKGTAQCALHAWGSQLRPCPCGCRAFPLSRSRLESKGLHGCLVRSAAYPDGTTHIRHIHPNEAMCLNTMDPVLDFEFSPRLVLSAVGQIAAPIQALWVFGFLVSRFTYLLRGISQFDSVSQVQAYRSWLLMRSRLVWNASDFLDDPKQLALVQFWETQKDLSLEELLCPDRWKGSIDFPISIAAILDHLIRSHQTEVPMTIADDDENIAPTPWVEQPSSSQSEIPTDCTCEDLCTVVFEGSNDSPIRFQPKCTTVGDFLTAHQKLVGTLHVGKVTLNGETIMHEHVMKVGQTIYISLMSDAEAPSEPVLQAPDEISPTLAWAVDPIEDVPVVSPPRKFNKFDVGVCPIPNPKDVSEDQWLDAGPLLGLHGRQFLCLKTPTVNTPQQLWSVRHQFLRVNDRLAVLEQQSDLWADDEIRIHIHNIIAYSTEFFPKKGLRAPKLLQLDPLLATMWIHGRGFNCECWAGEHPEVLQDSVSVLTAVLVDNHWIPVFMIPVKGVLQWHTWDSIGARHEALDELACRLSKALGFQEHLTCREHRLYFNSTLCGALAIGFLRLMVLGCQLPSNMVEARYVHDQLRQQFIQLISSCQVTKRPWIWGDGENSDVPPAQFDLQAISISRDQRIDLINQNGNAMADDEVRFHIMQLVDHQPRRVNVRGSFVFFEPLVFTCWDSIGHIIAEKWAEQHPQVYDQGQHVVTAVSLDNHWLPIWLAPAGMTLQVHTFNDDCIGRARLDMIIQALANRLGFSEITTHRIPKAVSDASRCGAYAMAFLAHVIMRMPLPETERELSTLHTNMRASFVAHLYSVESTPRPVVWGNGPKRESGQLPRMPDDEPERSVSAEGSGSHEANDALAPQSTVSPSCCIGLKEGEEVPGWPALSMFCTCATAKPASEEWQLKRQQRLEGIAPRGHAMADDEILFHLEHILEFHRRIPRSSQENPRVFVHIPPLTVAHWLAGNAFEIAKWRSESQYLDHMCHIIFAACIDKHWVPFWLSPHDAVVRCHTFHHPNVDTTHVDASIRVLVSELGFSDCVIHRVPNPVHGSGLCGAMALSFLAHIVLRTPMPQDDQQLRDRSWKMKQKFADSIHSRPPTDPIIWGWTGERESRQLPIMPEDSPFVAEETCYAHELVFPLTLPYVDQVRQSPAMGSDEMLFHLEQLALHCPFVVQVQVLTQGIDAAMSSLTGHGCDSHMICAAVWEEYHWFPVSMVPRGRHTLVIIERSRLSDLLRQFTDLVVIVIPKCKGNFCGAYTIQSLAVSMGYKPMSDCLQFVHWSLRQCFPAQDQLNVKWGFGPNGQLLKTLTAELLKHGIPSDVVESRAAEAIKALGSEQVAKALGHRQPWRHLKILGNHAKFHFVLPTELDEAIARNKGQAVGGKGKGKSKGKSLPTPAGDLDPHKLQVLEGTFKSHAHPVSQILATQIGPISSGVVLMTAHEAEPYLKAGKQVSQEPLAIAVLKKSGMNLTTVLPHSEVTIPCRCTLDHEPVLVDAYLVQIGTGLIEKTHGTAVVHIDSLEVVTLKIMVYKDELQVDWQDFCQAPIRCLVSLFPMLKRCTQDTCDCAGWHNPEKLDIRDPILDVWRRQYLRNGFKPSTPEKADMFSVCVRIPQCIMEPLLASSGNAGAYCEPRTADGKEILAEYTVVWTPKHSLQEMQHLMRTNPAVTGLARLGDRKGLRVHAAQAKTIHQLVRPDSVFLPQGPKCQFTVGPMPYGVDRQAVGRILSKAGWECRPLQPTTPCPGRGAMWIVQATEEPSQAIIHTSHGEIVISKQKQEVSGTTTRQVTVGSATTLALCGAQGSNPAADADPWNKGDPWGGYKPLGNVSHPTAPAEGILQMEERIQTAVLAKMHTPMERDDVPDRVHSLESQVQQLMVKQQSLEGQMQDFNGQHTQQLASLQTQVNAQAQQIHGHLENQNQTIQSLFEQQMTQIRTLLAKRPREDSNE